MEIFVVEACCDYEGCICLGVFNTLPRAKNYILTSGYNYGEEITITFTKINSLIDPYGSKTKTLTYNTRFKKWK